MFNLIKMEMHRLTHSTVTWITIVFAILTAIFGIAMTDMDIQAVQDEPPTGLIIQENTDDDSSGMLAGVYVTGNPEWANGKIELGDLVGMELQSGLTSILCVILRCLRMLIKRMDLLKTSQGSSRVAVNWCSQSSWPLRFISSFCWLFFPQ